MHILIVDDDPLSAELAGAVLAAAGHQYTVADSGFAALELLANGGPPDLVISDLNMPLMDGLELSQLLRDQGLNVPFVLLSGDDPAPLLAAHPHLAGALLKDASLLETLPGLVATLDQARQ